MKKIYIYYRSMLFTLLLFLAAAVPAFAAQQSCSATSITFTASGEYELHDGDTLIEEGEANGVKTIEDLEAEKEYQLTANNETIPVYTEYGDKRPLDVIGETVLTYNLNRQYPDISVYDGDTKIDPAKYERKIVYGDGTRPGVHKLRLRFRNGMHEPIYITYKILPKKQTLKENDATTSSVTLKIYQQKGKTTVRYSESADMTNAKSASSTTDSIQLTGLKKGKKYYVEQYTTVNGVSSEVSKMTMMTAGTPRFSANDPFVRAILSQVKAAEKNSPQSFSVETPYATYGITTKVIRAMVDAYPEYFRMYSVSIYPMHLTFTRNSTSAQTAKAEVKALRSYVINARKRSGTVSRLRYLNKRMCRNVSYDYTAYRYWKKHDHQMGQYRNSYSTYGALVRKRAVCMGYTKTFNAACFRLGIEAHYISDATHAWSKVKVGSRWYYIDVTSNDTSGRTTKYFLKRKHRGKTA